METWNKRKTPKITYKVESVDQESVENAQGGLDVGG